MENYKLQESLSALNAVVTQFENGLRTFGVEINTLPEDIKKMLDVCVETQVLTGLHDMEEVYLKEYYLQKRREQVDNRLAASKLQVEIDNLKKQIQEETAECDMLKKFLNQPVISDEESRINASLLDANIRSLQSKLDQMHMPENFDIDDLMKKIEILKCRETEGKK